MHFTRIGTCFHITKNHKELIVIISYVKLSLLTKNFQIGILTGVHIFWRAENQETPKRIKWEKTPSSSVSEGARVLAGSGS
jgi:hypothetical protein